MFSPHYCCSQSSVLVKPTIKVTLHKDLTENWRSNCTRGASFAADCAVRVVLQHPAQGVGRLIMAVASSDDTTLLSNKCLPEHVLTWSVSLVHI